MNMFATWLKALEHQAALLRATPMVAGDMNVRAGKWGGTNGVTRELGNRGVPGQGSKQKKRKGV